MATVGENFKVKVAVRVRKAAEEELLQVADPEVVVSPQSTNGGSRGQPKKFIFDKVFSSLTSQTDVYRQFGQDMVEHTLEGYNACIFAYGQTGSGKTHTMLGSKDEPGLIPQICARLFKHVTNVQAEAAVTVRFSFLEIYNEHIRDLLAPPTNSGTGTASLKLRGTDECQVVGLGEYKVTSVEEVVKLMNRGSHHRATAATLMNDVSSRSHAVVSLMIKQQVLGEKSELQEKISVMRLVDLAGSERAGSTGATGDRLREGGNINKSLVTLGRVISTLAEPRTSSVPRVVPYRDSVLTRLLQSSLGGNSRTAMIACVSPLTANIDQTLSTLRYADQAKNITTSAHINADTISNATQEARLQQMQQELAELRQQLSNQTSHTEEADSARDSKLAKLVQFYEDEAARERVRSNMLDRQRQDAEQRSLDLADYVREISGKGMSSIDLRDTESFERLVDAQQELQHDVGESRRKIQNSLAKWREVVK